ncbi:MAG: D-glycerate dehydrogenase [Alteraurantiacibacter sp.]
MRVLVTRRWPEAVERAMRCSFDVTLNKGDGPMSQSEMAAAMGEYDIIAPTVSDRIDAKVLAGGDRVKMIANYGVGVDHIDLDTAKARGIAVTNTPGVLTDATADLAMMLVLMATRRAGEGIDQVRDGAWDGWQPTHLMGSGLDGKVLGTVGFGRIGQALAKRAAHGFGMRIACHARHEVQGTAVQATFYPDLHEMLAESDVVSLHVPGGAETDRLIDARAIGAMKRGSYLVNTARGSVLDHHALAEALLSGHIAGAGLDVYPDEPAVPPALLSAPNAVCLPHLGSATVETREAMGMRALANIRAFAAGEKLPDRVA